MKWWAPAVWCLTAQILLHLSSRDELARLLRFVRRTGRALHYYRSKAGRVVLTREGDEPVTVCLGVMPITCESRQTRGMREQAGA